MASFDHRLLSALECPSCKKYIHPPMHQCEAGHTLCNNCFQVVKRCSVCGFKKSMSRSYALENVHAKLIFPCKHRQDGCHFVDLGRHIQGHENNCPFRQLPCPLEQLDCRWSGTLKHVSRHCKEHHQGFYYESSRQRLTCENFIKHDGTTTSSYRILFKAHGQLFKCAWNVDYVTGPMKWCVYHIGAHTATRRYNYEVQIENLNSDGHLIIQAPCQPNMDERNILNEEECITTYYDVVKRFCHSHDLVYIVKIFDNGEF